MHSAPTIQRRALQDFQESYVTVGVADVVIEVVCVDVRREAVHGAAYVTCGSEVLLECLHEPEADVLISMSQLDVELQYLPILRRISIKIVILRTLGNGSSNTADDLATVIRQIDHSILCDRLFKKPLDVTVPIEISRESDSLEIV